MLPNELMTDFLAIALYLLVGVIFAVVPIIISSLIVSLPFII